MRAHSLSDSFQCHLGSEPLQISERLWGQEVDSLKETEKHWGLFRDGYGHDELGEAKRYHNRGNTRVSREWRNYSI